jgi:superfamily II DNA or RNA helicase/predicted nuclease with RNAse H fold
MPLLRDRTWKAKYDRGGSDLLNDFYVPALQCAERYDRATGYFSAASLTRAARGIEGLIANKGHMRLIVGATLGPDEAKAIEEGEQLASAITQKLAKSPLEAEDPGQTDALELLAWMVAQGHLEVRIAVPCDESRKPTASTAIFHAKTGIIADPENDRIAFSGSVNETVQGWTSNWESFHVFRDWDGGVEHVDSEDDTFAQLWRDEAGYSRVVDVSEAVRKDLLQFQPPEGQKPKRIGGEPSDEDPPPDPPDDVLDNPQADAWNHIWAAPTLLNGGERIGEATCPVEPWPHQLRTFYRMYENWPPRLLIADEVGLGKTITAGLLLRQAWLSGRAKRILILTPAAVLRQWQLELREKFNLNWPIYDGSKLRWAKCPGFGLEAGVVKEKAVANDAWHREPFVLASSQLMRRRDRKKELLENAEPYDLIVLDEAHHARRRGAGAADGGRPNMLLDLMRRLKDKTEGLLLLTATPMQIDPIEVWDLLDLLGLPPEWSPLAFTQFFDRLSSGNPSDSDIAAAARLFRAAEQEYGQTLEEDVARIVTDAPHYYPDLVLNRLRDRSGQGLRSMDTKLRKAAIRVMQANTPIARRVARHTRKLLREYQNKGLLGLQIADRDVHDEFIGLSDNERQLYEAVEDYISSTYERADAGKKSAVGFVMTVYRRRMASSFHALSCTLEKRLKGLEDSRVSVIDAVDDADDDELREEVMDAEEAGALAQESLIVEEQDEIRFLLDTTRQLPTDTKARRLLAKLQDLQKGDRPQAMVFTQYGDTMQFLRRFLTGHGLSVLCFSGAGGEIEESGSWTRVSRDRVKQLFREGYGDVLVCTDAAAEGLNFQFCGALVNYDMPWNPMRVEQRIGRIDRLGQKFPEIRVVNMHYQDTVETDVYRALRKRVKLFEQFVGSLQPILAKLPREISAAVLAGRGARDDMRRRLIDSVEQSANEEATFDLDELVASDLDVSGYPQPTYGMDKLEDLLQQELLPSGTQVSVADATNHEYRFSSPGMVHEVRVTTRPDYYEQHPESVVLWSPGAPLFPDGRTEDTDNGSLHGS